MGMAPDELVGNCVDDVAEGEIAGLFRHASVKDDLQKKIAQFVLQIVPVVARNGVGDLIGFFDRVGRNGCEGLFEVPWTAGLGRPQRRHDFEEARDFIRHCRRGFE